MSLGMDTGWRGASAPYFTWYVNKLPELQLQHHILSVSSPSFADNGLFSKAYGLTVCYLRN